MSLDFRELVYEDESLLLDFYSCLCSTSSFLLIDENMINLEKNINEYIKRITKDNNICLVAVKDDKIVGHVTGEISNYYKKRHVMEISMGILPYVKGIGFDLLSRFIHLAIQRKLYKLEGSVIESNSRFLHLLITKFGFFIEGRKINSVITANGYESEYLLGKIL